MMACFINLKLNKKTDDFNQRKIDNFINAIFEFKMQI